MPRGPPDLTGSAQSEVCSSVISGNTETSQLRASSHAVEGLGFGV